MRKSRPVATKVRKFLPSSVTEIRNGHNACWGFAPSPPAPVPPPRAQPCLSLSINRLAEPRTLPHPDQWLHQALSLCVPGSASLCLIVSVSLQGGQCREKEGPRRPLLTKSSLLLPSSGLAPCQCSTAQLRPPLQVHPLSLAQVFLCTLGTVVHRGILGHTLEPGRGSAGARFPPRLPTSRVLSLWGALGFQGMVWGMMLWDFEIQRGWLPDLWGHLPLYPLPSSSRTFLVCRLCTYTQR